MLYGHDEGKNIKQLCNGETDVVCIEMGGTGANTAEGALDNLLDGEPLPVSMGGTGANTLEAIRNAVLGYTPSIMKLCRKTDSTSYSTTYNSFNPLSGAVNTDIDIECSIGNLTHTTKKIATYGDRSDETVRGVLIGANVNCVRVNYGVYYLNNDSSNTAAIGTYLHKLSGSNNEIASATRGLIAAGGRITNEACAVINVSEGDFIFLRSYKATKTRDVDVIGDYKATHLTVEAIY